MARGASVAVQAVAVVVEVCSNSLLAKGRVGVMARDNVLVLTQAQVGAMDQIMAVQEPVARMAVMLGRALQ